MPFMTRKKTEEKKEEMPQVKEAPSAEEDVRIQIITAYQKHRGLFEADVIDLLSTQINALTELNNKIDKLINLVSNDK